MAYTITATIEGIAPILFNAPSLDMLKPSGKRSKTDEERDTEAMKRCYRNGSGLYLPAWNMKRCILDGIQSLDLRVAGNKNKRLWKVAQPVMFLQPPEIPFDAEEPDFLHRCPGKNADGSATIVRRPAMNEGWHLTFEIRILDPSVILPDTLRDVLQASGERVGLGGWRPEYGRFIVTDWNVEEDA